MSPAVSENLPGSRVPVQDVFLMCGLQICCLLGCASSVPSHHGLAPDLHECFCDTVAGFPKVIQDIWVTFMTQPWKSFTSVGFYSPHETAMVSVSDVEHRYESQDVRISGAILQMGEHTAPQRWLTVVWCWPLEHLFPCTLATMVDNVSLWISYIFTVVNTSKTHSDLKVCSLTLHT